MKYKVIKAIGELTAADKPLKRAFETYFKLKAINTDGHFRSAQYAELARKCNITTPTLYTRIAAMKAAGLIVKSKKSFNLISYENVCQKFNVSSDAYYTRQTDIQLILDAMCIRLSKERMQKAFAAKIKRYNMKDALNVITGPDKLESLMEAMLRSQIADHQKNASPAAAELYIANPDDNLNYESLSSMFNYKGFGSMAYKKRKLQKLHIATITHRQYRIHAHRYTSKLGNVCYFRPNNARVLVMCDNITIH